MPIGGDAVGTDEHPLRLASLAPSGGRVRLANGGVLILQTDTAVSGGGKRTVSPRG